MLKGRHSGLEGWGMSVLGEGVGVGGGNAFSITKTLQLDESKP